MFFIGLGRIIVKENFAYPFLFGRFALPHTETIKQPQIFKKTIIAFSQYLIWPFEFLPFFYYSHSCIYNIFHRKLPLNSGLIKVGFCLQFIGELS